MNKNARPMVACKARTIITALLALIAMAGQGQEARTDTVVPKFPINGYFFRGCRNFLMPHQA